MLELLHMELLWCCHLVQNLICFQSKINIFNIAKINYPRILVSCWWTTNEFIHCREKVCTEVHDHLSLAADLPSWPLFQGISEDCDCQHESVSVIPHFKFAFSVGCHLINFWILFSLWLSVLSKAADVFFKSKIFSCFYLQVFILLS